MHLSQLGLKEQGEKGLTRWSLENEGCMEIRAVKFSLRKAASLWLHCREGVAGIKTLI